MGHTPFSNPLVLMEYCIGRVNPLVGEKGFSDELMAFMARLLDPDGGRRISAREAMEMPWIVTAVEEERKLTNGSDMLKQQCEAMKDKLESVQEKMEQVTEERDRLRGAVEELELNELRKMMKKLAGCQSAMSATFETMQQNAMNPIRNIR